MLREDFQDTVTEMSLTIIFVTILVVTVVFIQVKSKTRIFRVAKVSRHNENIRILIRFEFRIEPDLFGCEPSIHQRGRRLNISGLAVRGCLDWIIRVHGRFWPRFWFISTWNFQGFFRTIMSSMDEIAFLTSLLSLSILIFSSIGKNSLEWLHQTIGSKIFSVYLAEHNVPNTKFSSIPSSIWWSCITITTVGYGDVVPSTIMGKCKCFVHRWTGQNGRVHVHGCPFLIERF